MNELKDMNSLDSVALKAEQLVLLRNATNQYSGSEFQETAEEVRERMERCLMEDRFEGSSVYFSNEEYRASVEALKQYERGENEPSTSSELIDHLKWFKA